MRDFLSLNQDERTTLIVRTSEVMGISPLLIEKDFWVCWLLRQLFSLHCAEDLIFKGGTSLSKAFGIIQRFSEDIDITIDKKQLGYDPQQIITKKKTDRHLETLNHNAKEYIFKNILKHLNKECGKILGKEEWEIKTETENFLNLRFYYPSLVQGFGNEYFKQSVFIEFGVRGEIEPYDIVRVQSYIQCSFAHILKEPDTKIKVLSPVRTFWEKITLIHAENNRPLEKDIPDRLSRHYYDIFQLIEKGVAEKALENVSLLYDVIRACPQFRLSQIKEQAM